MKQKLKALASLCLALALTLCLTLPAWAAGDGGLTKGSTGTVTIKELPETSTENLKVTAYKIIEVNYYSVEDDKETADVDESYDAPYDPAFDWVSENDTADDDSKSVADWVRENYRAYIGLAEQGKEPDNSVQDEFKKDAPGVDFAAFYDDLANAIRKNDVTFDSDYTVESGTTGVPEGDPSITLTQEPAVGQTPATVTCELKNFKMGSYLVLIEGGMKIYKPVVVNLTPKWENGAWTLPQDVPDLTAKYSEPGITKEVIDGQADADTDISQQATQGYAQVAIGDKVTYVLKATVPTFPSDAINKGYQISDILPAGMTLNADSITVWGYTGESDEIGDKIYSKETSTGNTVCTPTTTNATRPVDSNEDEKPDPVTFNLNFVYNELHDSNSARYTELIVTYTATANKDIKVVGDSEGEHTNTIGNQNTAYLDYNNNPYEATATSWQTASDTAIVYTYGIKVTKTDDKKPGELLAGAEFQVYKVDSPNAEIAAGATPLNFVAVVGNDGTYRFAASTETEGKSSTVAVGGENSSNKGNLTLFGLDVGTYILKETKAPDGYNLPSRTFRVTITDEKNTSGTTAAEKATPNGKPEYTPSENGATETDRADGYERINITNTKGFTLPTTGGMGTVLFTAGGVVLMGAGLVLLVVFLRRRRAK